MKLFLHELLKEQDIYKIVDLEKRYKNKRNLARELGYNYTALCRAMRKSGSKLFSRKIAKLTCYNCKGLKTFSYKFIRKVLHYSYKNNDQNSKPFCSRSCYYRFLRIDRGVKLAKLAIYNKIRSKESKLPPFPFMEKMGYSRTDVVIASWFHRKLDDMSRAEFIKRTARTLDTSPGWIRKCLKAGFKREIEKKGGRNYVSTTTLEQLKYINDQLRNTDYREYSKSIFTYIDKLCKEDERINIIYNFLAKRWKEDNERDSKKTKGLEKAHEEDVDTRKLQNEALDKDGEFFSYKKKSRNRRMLTGTKLFIEKNIKDASIDYLLGIYTLNCPTLE